MLRAGEWGGAGRVTYEWVLLRFPGRIFVSELASFGLFSAKVSPIFAEFRRLILLRVARGRDDSACRICKFMNNQHE
ncbi:hypothetical protein chiPu_0002685 [Chiloscyllium punctatum]|uniref:Uncharacterized protein n=1 Tax=Chiloscyllium punctatum TaxID=137246 RepID=A0A401S1M1_CHIPU|nr:hypothetical protein [Chiloscyllium punctatum]